MNIFKHTWFWLLVILVVLLGVFLLNGIVITQTSSEYFNLKPEELSSLKEDALERRDVKAAWRIYNYYSTTKRNHVEGEKWEKIAREIESNTCINLDDRGLSNNLSDGK